VAKDTEMVGQDMLAELRQQRETLLHARDGVREVDSNLSLPPCIPLPSPLHLCWRVSAVLAREFCALHTLPPLLTFAYAVRSALQRPTFRMKPPPSAFR
jgi:hypothetical protein